MVGSEKGRKEERGFGKRRVRTRSGREERGGRRRTILVPLDRVSVIHRELVVEVVVSLSDGDESRDEVILGSVLVVVGSLSNPVSERVDTEGGL